MYRTVFTPSAQNSSIPVVIPDEWYGQKVEVLVFPISGNEKQVVQELSIQARRRKREELLNRYPIDLSDFTFNRDEANDYD
jgi:hypothetical protein